MLLTPMYHFFSNLLPLTDKLLDFVGNCIACYWLTAHSVERDESFTVAAAIKIILLNPNKDLFREIIV